MNADDFGSDEERHREQREDELWRGLLLFALMVIVGLALVGTMIWWFVG